jgi:hypothetical protein
MSIIEKIAAIPTAFSAIRLIRQDVKFDLLSQEFLASCGAAGGLMIARISTAIL